MGERARGPLQRAPMLWLPMRPPLAALKSVTPMKSRFTQMTVVHTCGENGSKARQGVRVSYAMYVFRKGFQA